MPAPHSPSPSVHTEKGNAGLAAQLSLHKRLWVSLLYYEGMLDSAGCCRWFLLLPRGLDSAEPRLQTSLVITLQGLSLSSHLSTSSVLLPQDANNGCFERLYVGGEHWQDQVGVRSHKTTMRLADGSHFPLQLHRLSLVPQQRRWLFGYWHSCFHVFWIIIFKACSKSLLRDIQKSLIV